MSALTDYLNTNIKPLCDSFFDAHAHEFNLTVNSGCGTYTEALVRHLQALGYSKVGHLKKSPGQTQYNGHANDAILYREGDPSLYRAVDLIGAAESTDLLNPPRKNFGIDEPRYTDEFWLASPASGGTSPSNMVPWVAYDENGFQELKRELAYDYARRPQGADFDVSVWAARTFHNAFMGPDKTPLGMSAGISRARNEWCASLGVAVVPVPPTWHIGDPV